MAIFRGNDDFKDSSDSTVDDQVSDQDTDSFFSGDSQDSEADPQERLERKKLDRQRNLNGRGKLQNANQSTPDKAEKQKISNLIPDKKSTAKKLIASSAKSQAAIGLGLFIGPTLIGLLLWFILGQSGFVLEHISRITTGVRFGSLHLSLSKRFNHVRREYVRNSLYQDQLSTNQFARYSKTTLGSRLLGVTPDNIYQHLNQKGYRFEYSRLAGSKITLGQRTLSKITYPDGTTRQIKSQADALQFLQDIGNNFDDTETSRFRATRASFLLAKQIGIPFVRFRLLIDGLRSGQLRNSIRGSPQQFVRQRINEEMITIKRSLGQRIPLLGKSLGRFGLNEMTENISNNIKEDSLSRVKLDKELSLQLDNRRRVFAGAAKASLAIGLLTLVCVIRELGVVISEALKMKVRGLQDNATTLITTTSQMRAGDMDGHIVSDLSQRFDGFATSATYQVAANGQPASQYLGAQGSDWSQEFGAETAIGGLSVQGVSAFNKIFNPQQTAGLVEQYAKQASSFMGGIISTLLNVAGSGIKLTADWFNKSFDAVCNLALNSVVQIATAAVEIVAIIVASMASFGLGAGASAGAKVGTTQLIQAIVGRIGGRLLISVAGGVALDAFLFNVVLPDIVKSASGVDTALLAPSTNDPTAGSRNYAAVDYGMHYLKEGEALRLGGSRVPVASALAQTKTYLAQERQNYANQHFLANVASLDNPYSLVSKLAVSFNSTSSWKAQSQNYLSDNWKTTIASVGLQQAQNVATNQTEAELQLLYPGQKTTIGFNNQEVEGVEPGFNHIDNTIYVHDNLDYLKEEYSQCLGLSEVDFILTQQGVLNNRYGRSHYPESCDSQEARRFKLYYQDCVLIDGLNRWGSNTSPLTSSVCDDLLPQTTLDTAELSTIPDLSGIIALEADSFQALNSQPRLELLSFKEQVITTPVSSYMSKTRYLLSNIRFGFLSLATI